MPALILSHQGESAFQKGQPQKKRKEARPKKAGQGRRVGDSLPERPEAVETPEKKKNEPTEPRKKRKTTKRGDEGLFSFKTVLPIMGTTASGRVEKQM